MQSASELQVNRNQAKYAFADEKGWRLLQEYRIQKAATSILGSKGRIYRK